MKAADANGITPEARYLLMRVPVKTAAERQVPDRIAPRDSQEKAWVVYRMLPARSAVFPTRAGIAAEAIPTVSAARRATVPTIEGSSLTGGGGFSGFIYTK